MATRPSQPTELTRGVSSAGSAHSGTVHFWTKGY